MQSAHVPGWYPDPTDRFEYRYHNGVEWTGDVSDDGRRFLDPLDRTGPGGGPPPYVPSTEQRNGIAVAALVLGIVALILGWLPFVFVLGGLAAVLAIVFAAVGLRRARARGVGRAMSIAGLVLGIVGIGATVIGAFVTSAFVDAFDRYDHPAEHSVDVTRCEFDAAASPPAWFASGTLTNRSDDEADFSLDVDFVRTGTDNVQRTIELELDDVAPGATVTFEAVWPSTLHDGGLDCLVDVHGPLPFGIDPD